MGLKKYFEVLYNESSDGFTLPGIVLKEYYKLKKKEIKCRACKREVTICFSCYIKIENNPLARTDPILISLCKKHDIQCKGLCIKGNYNMAYIDCVTIHKDNEVETVILCLEKFMKNAAKRGLPINITDLPYYKGVKKIHRLCKIY